MHLVVEYEKGGTYQLQVLIDVDEIDTTQFEPVKKIFFCENMMEVVMVVCEIKREKLNDM
jgi:hypothetical protein